MKIAIIGAGSTYTPELMDGLIERREELPLAELCLMDIDTRKLKVVGGLAQRMAAAAGLPAQVKLTQDLEEALRGADFVLAQIRVGQLPARILDETIPLRHGLLGQETTGIGGFFKALRTIPVMRDIASRMERLCPGAWLVNFSNPSGILAEMLLNHTGVRAIGLCNVPINMHASLCEGLGLNESEAQSEFFGLNHLSWVTSIQSGGREYIEEALGKGLTGGQMKNIKGGPVDYGATLAAGAIPSSYLQYFYFPRQKIAEEQAEEKSRGMVCAELEEDLLHQYADPALAAKPEGLAARGGARYSEAAVALVSAIYNDKNERHVVNVQNGGAVDFLPASDVVEVAATVGKNGASPIPVTRVPAGPKALVQTVKAYEKFTVQAALEGDETAAMRALMANPLTADYAVAKACFAELLQAHRAYLPQFFKEV